MRIISSLVPYLVFLAALWLGTGTPSEAFIVDHHSIKQLRPLPIFRSLPLPRKRKQYAVDENRMLQYRQTRISSTLRNMETPKDETNQDNSLWETILSTYLGPRIILALLAASYATNFPLGSIMNEHLPASAATTGRMVLAALALSPFVPRLTPTLRVPAVLCGCFTAAGYITQSLALVEIDPARVSFLGSATVLWCPLLELWIDKKPMGLKESPQTWLAAILCMAGVGSLELTADTLHSASFSITTGDILALSQAVGFGTGVFWTSRMLANEPDQALPVTATLVATTSFVSMLWSLADGWMFTDPDWQNTLALPGMLLNPDMALVAGAIVWTGLISTSLTFWVELMALGRINPSEASVILASEPLWAALFAAVFLGQSLSPSDAIGGSLIVAACLANALLRKESFAWMWSKEESP